MKVSTMVCGLSWVSSFVLSWGWLFERIPVSPVSILLFLFYIVIGLGAGFISLLEWDKIKPLQKEQG